MEIIYFATEHVYLQMHGNNIMPANFMTGFQNFSPHNFNNMSTPFGNFNEGQFDSNETWNG